MMPCIRTLRSFVYAINACLFCLIFFSIRALAYDYPFPDAPAQFPALPETAVGPTIPQNPGWVVSHVNSSSNVFWVTDGNYQAMFIVTPTGVAVVDAPEPLPFFPALPVLAAVRSVTSLPITQLIYTHAHTDHIGGAGLIKAAYPKVEIIAQEQTKRILERENDPRRPIPTRTFGDQTVLDIAGERIELSYFGPIHVEGNTFVYLPRQKILMVVDVVFPGWVPFKGLALSGNVAAWARAHEIILKFDFDTLVTGHLGRLGNRQDVTVAKAYIDDIKNFVEEAYLDQTTLFSAVGAIDGSQGPGFSFQPVAKWALFSGFFDFSVKRCADKLDAKWLGRLGGAESFNFSNCEAWFVARRLGTENWYPKK